MKKHDVEKRKMSNSVKANEYKMTTLVGFDENSQQLKNAFQLLVGGMRLKINSEWL